MSKKTKGYATELSIDKENKSFTKKFDETKIKNIVGTDKSISKILQEEVDSIKKLNKVKNPYIITPEILEVNEKKHYFKQRYIEGDHFYKHLIKNCNKLYFNKKLINTFYEFGKFLGKFHKKYEYRKDKENIPHSHLHGDLNSKNIMFVKKNKIFVFDPLTPKGTIYIDITKFIMNIYLINPFIKLFLSKKGLNELKNIFLKGYEEKGFKLDKKKLKKELLERIDKRTKTYIKGQGLSYKIRKKLSDWEAKKVHKKIEEKGLEL